MQSVLFGSHAKTLINWLIDSLLWSPDRRCWDSYNKFQTGTRNVAVSAYAHGENGKLITNRRKLHINRGPWIQWRRRNARRCSVVFVRTSDRSVYIAYSLRQSKNEKKNKKRSNCHSQSCTLSCDHLVGNDTLFANFLVLFIFQHKLAPVFIYCNAVSTISVRDLGHSRTHKHTRCAKSWFRIFYLFIFCALIYLCVLLVSLCKDLPRGDACTEGCVCALYRAWVKKGVAPILRHNFAANFLLRPAVKEFFF